MKFKMEQRGSPSKFHAHFDWPVNYKGTWWDGELDWPCWASPSASGSLVWPPAGDSPHARYCRWDHKEALEDRNIPNTQYNHHTSILKYYFPRVETALNRLGVDSGDLLIRYWNECNQRLKEIKFKCKLFHLCSCNSTIYWFCSDEVLFLTCFKGYLFSLRF